MAEVGRNSKYCKSSYQLWQSACCSISKATSVYDTCYLTKLDTCTLRAPEKCKNEYSNFGYFSKQFICYDAAIHVLTEIPAQLCCSPKITNNRIESCEWFDSIGETLPGAGFKNGCKVGCPEDRIRMTTDTSGAGRCYKDGGTRANCCKYVTADLKLVNDETAGELKEALGAFLQDPTCPNPGYLHNPFKPGSADLVGEIPFDGLFGGGLIAIPKREIGEESSPFTFNTALNTSSTLQRPNYHHVRFLVGWLGNIISTLLSGAPLDRRIARQADIWDLQVREQYPNLQIARIREAVPQWQLAARGAIEAANELICHVNEMNQMVKWMEEERLNKAYREERRKQHLALDCDWDHCDREGCPFYPPGEQWHPDTDLEPTKRMAARSALNETM
jgi:hypothetical protein